MCPFGSIVHGRVCAPPQVNNIVYAGNVAVAALYVSGFTYPEKSIATGSEINIGGVADCAAEIEIEISLPE